MNVSTQAGPVTINPAQVSTIEGEPGEVWVITMHNGEKFYVDQEHQFDVDCLRKAIP